MLFQRWSDLGQVLATSLLVYPTLVLVLRVSGKRTLAKMNAFDLVVTVALGSTLATILLSADVSLAEGVLALVLLVGLQLAVAWMSASASARVTQCSSGRGPSRWWRPASQSPPLAPRPTRAAPGWSRPGTAAPAGPCRRRPAAGRGCQADHEPVGRADGQVEALHWRPAAPRPGWSGPGRRRPRRPRRRPRRAARRRPPRRSRRSGGASRPSSGGRRAGGRQVADPGLHAVGEQHAEQGQLGELPDHRDVGGQRQQAQHSVADQEAGDQDQHRR